MVNLPHIISPLSAPWCGWVLFGLLLSAVLSEWMQPGIIRQAHTSLMAQTDRIYKSAPMNPYGQMLISLFRIGTWAMGLAVCLYDGGNFRFEVFAAIAGCVVAVLLVKMLCNLWLDYTFSLSRRYGTPYEQYGDLATLITCLMYAGILLTLYIGDLRICRWVLGGATVLFLIMCLYRATRQYIQSPKAILYVILYICTLEILPIGILFHISSKTIASI